MLRWEKIIEAAAHNCVHVVDNKQHLNAHATRAFGLWKFDLGCARATLFSALVEKGKLLELYKLWGIF